MKSGSLVSVATAALVATVAGVGGTLPVVLAAEEIAHLDWLLQPLSAGLESGMPSHPPALQKVI